MPVKVMRKTIHLTGSCGVEDVEPLLSWLEGSDCPKVNVSGCTHLHGAVFQVLLAAKPQIAGTPKDEFLAQWILPSLAK